jgi:hypothetical protein
MHRSHRQILPSLMTHALFAEWIGRRRQAAVNAKVPLKRLYFNGLRDGCQPARRLARTLLFRVMSTSPLSVLSHGQPTNSRR